MLSRWGRGLCCEAGERGDEVGNATFLSRARSLLEVVCPLRRFYGTLAVRVRYVWENIAIVGRGCGCGGR